MIFANTPQPLILLDRTNDVARTSKMSSKETLEFKKYEIYKHISSPLNQPQFIINTFCLFDFFLGKNRQYFFDLINTLIVFIRLSIAKCKNISTVF